MGSEHDDAKELIINRPGGRRLRYVLDGEVTPAKPGNDICKARKQLEPTDCGFPDCGCVMEATDLTSENLDSWNAWREGDMLYIRTKCRFGTSIQYLELDEARQLRDWLSSELAQQDATAGNSSRTSNSSPPPAPAEPVVDEVGFVNPHQLSDGFGVYRNPTDFANHLVVVRSQAADEAMREQSKLDAGWAESYRQTIDELTAQVSSLTRERDEAKRLNAYRSERGVDWGTFAGRHYLSIDGNAIVLVGDKVWDATLFDKYGELWSRESIIDFADNYRGKSPPAAGETQPNTNLDQISTSAVSPAAGDEAWMERVVRDYWDTAPSERRSSKNWEEHLRAALRRHAPQPTPERYPEVADFLDAFGNCGWSLSYNPNGDPSRLASAWTSGTRDVHFDRNNIAAACRAALATVNEEQSDV